MAFAPTWSLRAGASRREDPDVELRTPDAGFAEHLTLVLAAARFRAPAIRREERDALSRPDLAS